MRRLIVAACYLLLGLSSAFAQPAPPLAMPSSPYASAPVRIRIVQGSATLTATLDPEPWAADFASLLPLTLTLEDFAATEKIAYLPRKLATNGAPRGTDPDVGDIAYYAPWGNLALFYRDAGFATGLIRLGRIEGSIAPLAHGGALSVRIERIEP